MKKYWYIHNKNDNNKDVAIAISPGNKTLVDWAIDILLLEKIPFEYKANDNEHLEDYLADDLGIPLMSEKLMRIIGKHLSGNEGIKWLQVFVSHRAEKIEYFAPKFEKNLDVLNTEKSLFNRHSGGLIKAHLSMIKIERYAFFPLPELSQDLPFTIRMVISDDIKQNIVNEKLSGMDFSKVPVS